MTWLEVKTFFMLSLTEHEISTAHKTNVLENMEFSCFKIFGWCINPAYKCCHFTNDEQDTFHHEKSFITFGFELLFN